MFAAGATRTVRTVMSLIEIPRIASAATAASSGVSASLTPPALPLPPTSTCALITTGRAMVRSIAAASSGVVATCPACRGTPYCARISLDRYSCSFKRRPSSYETALGETAPGESDSSGAPRLTDRTPGAVTGVTRGPTRELRGDAHPRRRDRPGARKCHQDRARGDRDQLRLGRPGGG